MVRSASVRALLLSIVLIAVLGSALYINSLDGRFVSDDHFLIGKVKKLASQPLNERMRGILAETRPLLTFSLVSDYLLWAENVRGYHITNTVLHILTALSVFWLIIILFDDWLLATFAGILFVSHPVQVESVAFISDRPGVMSALFSLLCIIFYIKNTRTKKIIFFILALLSFACALLSKENAIIVPVLLLLFHFSFKEKVNRGLFLSILLMPFVGLLVMRIIMGQFPGLPWFLAIQSKGTSLIEIGSLLRLTGFFAAVTNYLRILLVPFDLHLYYGSPLFAFTSPRVIVGLVIIVLMVTYAIKNRDKNRLIFFSVFWFLILLIPVNNVFPNLGSYMKEHWLYLPSVGFFVMVAYWFRTLYSSKTYRSLAILLFLFLMIFYCVLTVKQNTYWRNTLTLCKRILQINPQHGMANNIVGVEFIKHGRVLEAILLLEQAVKSEPDDPVPHNNLGSAYFQVGKYREAVEEYKKALRLAPYYAKVYNNIGEVFSALGQHEKAIASYNKAIELVPWHAEVYRKAKREHKINAVIIKPVQVRMIAYNNLGVEYVIMRKYGEAEDAYGKAIKVAPWHPEAYFNMANAYVAAGKIKESVGLYKEAIERNPKDISAHKNLGNVYIQLNKPTDALVSYNRALEVNPYDAGTFYNISLLFFREKEYSEAVVACDMAISLGYQVPPSFLEKLKPYRK